MGARGRLSLRFSPDLSLGDRPKGRGNLGGVPGVRYGESTVSGRDPQERPVANPVFNSSPVFQDPNARKGGNGRTAAPASTIDAVTLEKMYGTPSATPRET